MISKQLEFSSARWHGLLVVLVAIRILKLAMPRLGDAGPRASEFVSESVSTAPVAPELEAVSS